MLSSIIILLVSLIPTRPKLSSNFLSLRVLHSLYKCVCESGACVSVSISPWQHSSKTEPVRGLCLTSLFNQTQTHTSGQPGPRYLSLPPSARCTHPALSLFLLSPPPLPTFLLCLLSSPLLAFPTPPPPPPVQHPCASHCLPALHLSQLPVSCSLCPLQTPPPSYPAFSGLLSLLAT